jgi:hypothetical protein
VERTTRSVDELVEEQREIATSIDYDEARRRLAAVQEELARYRKTLEAMKQGPVLVSADFDASKMDEMLAEEQALKERIRNEDAAAQAEFYREKTRLDREASLEGIALLEYRLAEERRAYDEMGELDASNAERKQSAYERIKSLEKQLAQAHEDATDNLAALDAKYSTALIEDATARTQRELEIERDAELQKAQALGASEALLLNIRAAYAKRITQVEADAEAERVKNAETEAREKERVAQEAARAEEENADTRAEFFQAQLTYENNEYQAQIDAIDNYYAQRREKLSSAGITEEQITRQSEMAKQRIREEFEKRHIQGVSGILGNLAKTSQAFGKKGFALWKTFAIAQALVDTYASATAAFKAMAGIPIVGPGLAIAAAAAAVGAGLANVAQISKTEPPKAAKGGLLHGASHAQGGILIEAEGDEYITARERVKSLGTGLFNFLNFAPLGQVKAALGNLAFPAFPVPEPKPVYASGGSVGGSGSLSDLIDAVYSMRDEIVTTIRAQQLSLTISVDPLSNDPVKISELADTGKRIRAEGVGVASLFRVDFLMSDTTASDYGQIKHTLTDTTDNRLLVSLTLSADKLASVSNYTREPKRLVFECFPDDWLTANLMSGTQEFERYISKYEIKAYRDGVLIFTGIIDTSLLSYDYSTQILKITCYDKIRLFSIYSDIEQYFGLTAGYQPSWLIGYFIQNIQQRIPVNVGQSNQFVLPTLSQSNLTLCTVTYQDMEQLPADSGGWTYSLHSSGWGYPKYGYILDATANKATFCFAHKKVIQAHYANPAQDQYRGRFRGRIWKFFNNICPLYYDYDETASWTSTLADLDDDYNDLIAFFTEHGIAEASLDSLAQTGALNGNAYNSSHSVHVSVMGHFSGNVLPSMLHRARPTRPCRTTRPATSRRSRPCCYSTTPPSTPTCTATSSSATRAPTAPRLSTSPTPTSSA